MLADEQLGATPAADALRGRLREAGVRGLPPGARGSTRAHPAGLTGAEQKVLALLAHGLRNAEIAARIHRSVRTVDHHVAAVISKLGVDSRQAAMLRSAREGWLAAPGQVPGEPGAAAPSAVPAGNGFSEHRSNPPGSSRGSTAKVRMHGRCPNDVFHPAPALFAAQAGDPACTGAGSMACVFQRPPAQPGPTRP